LRSDVVYQTRAAIQFAFHSKHAGARQRKKRKSRCYAGVTTGLPLSISFSREVSLAKSPGKKIFRVRLQVYKKGKTNLRTGSTIMQTPFFTYTISKK